MRIDKITRKGRTITLKGSFQPGDLRPILNAANQGVFSVPMQRKLYAENWEEIALAVKDAAGWHCVVCNRPCRKPGEDMDVFLLTGFAHSGWDGEIRNYNEWMNLVLEAPVRFTLTVMHLDHNPANNEPDNLQAACSVCHLRYDAQHHAANAAATRRKRAEDAGQLPVWREDCTQ